MTDTPNILFLMADEHRADALSWLGHPCVKTPNLDRLAARGALFDNAYTPNPICVPARAALATGQYTHHTRYWDNAIAYDGRVPGYGHRLQDAGWRPTSIGKLHYRDGQDPTGFSTQILPMHIQDGIGQVWGSVRNPLPDSRRAGKMLAEIGAGYSSYNRYDEAVGAQSAEWLRGVDQSRPWMLFSSFVAPHFPLVVPQRFLDMYDPDQLPWPKLRHEDGHAHHPWLARMTGFVDNDGEFEDDAERRLAMASYFALCSFVDEQIGLVLDALEESGQGDNTVILYSSDHGETLGDRNRWGKQVLYCEATRIPMILSGPGVPVGRRVQTPVSLIDVAPTICDLAGLEPDADWPGTSLMGIANAKDDPERLVFSEYHAVGSPCAGFMLANARWKYHYYTDYPPELFDLISDPDEAENLAGRPGHQAVETNMHAALLAICAPDEVDRQAKADQDALIAHNGGREAALTLGPKGASPVPG